MYLVSWKGMQKGSKEALPMRPFDTKEEAEAYVIGCSDVIVIQSKNKLDLNKVVSDFEISIGEG
jgi:hypothetical protein